MLQVLQRVEHGPQLRETKPMIKLICKRLQIDIGRIHVPVKFGTRIVSDVTSRNRHSFNIACATRLGYVDRIFGKDDGIIVSKRD